jgi:hypothetical protein
MPACAGVLIPTGKIIQTELDGRQWMANPMRQGRIQTRRLDRARNGRTFAPPIWSRIRRANVV